MKRLLFLLMCCYVFSGCQKKTVEESNSIDVNEIVNILLGEYDNFQQCWQENTKDDIHAVKIENKHQHIHSKFERFYPLDRDSNDYFLLVTYSIGKDSKKHLGKEIHEFWTNGEDGSNEWKTFSTIHELLEDDGINIKMDNIGEPDFILSWEKKNEEFKASNRKGNLIYKIHGDTLLAQQNQGIFENKSNVPYQMLKCRFFSGWIQYPLPENPDSIYSLRPLKIHDQGGIVQLKLPDGTPLDYTVELTQLIFGKKIDLMKLAIYEMPKEEVSWNSYASSYTWTSPKAKRIGINLRRVVSGWTLIEEGYINSNNTKFKK